VTMTFLTGLLTGLLVSAAGTYFQRLSAKKKTQEELLFKVYMLLIELKSAHFWIGSREIRGEPPDSEQAKKFHDRAWQIADLLRQLDQLPELSAIAMVLFGLNFNSEAERGEEIQRLLDVLGIKLNPRYNAAMKQVSTVNQRLMIENFDEFWRRKKKTWPL